MSFSEDSSTRSWDVFADSWVSHADSNDYRNEFLMPRALQMMGTVAGLDILDMGCGEGGYSRELARRGARVVGIDGSPRLIDIARARTAEAGLAVDYRRVNASHGDELPSSSFDRVLATMSLMDVEDYPAAIHHVARVLRPNGELLMSITHPCFTAPVSRWMKDGAGQGKYFMVDRYFERIAWEDVMAPDLAQPVLRRHRPLEDFMEAPIAAGFLLREFREPLPSDEEVRKSARFWKLQRIPYFLFMRWVKGATG
jgi:ubiquinone/menaquinone biosynthesis C-methylase UbiE